jgi:hypothetical protein
MLEHGSELREASERGGYVSPPGRPKAKCAPSGGSELREASERGGYIFVLRLIGVGW